MDETLENLPLRTFHRVVKAVPAYRALIEEASICADDIKTRADFGRLPILTKENTFRRFPIEALCVDGEIGRLSSVLTSSGQSKGGFAFGLTEACAASASTQWIDDSLDLLFGVRTLPTLLINCLPMGVKVNTQACTLAETSVRPDMAIGLIQAFGKHYKQIILVGEAAFVKHLAEMGVRAGVDWGTQCIHVILGEEPLAENARSYLERVLQIDPQQPQTGTVCSSMGVGELGLNLFGEVPPHGDLINFRRALHADAALRTQVFGPSSWVPPLFTYDPRRIFVEFDENKRLILTTLEEHLRLPLIRYATGDFGQFVTVSPDVRLHLQQLAISTEVIDAIPIVAIFGRGKGASSPAGHVFPEAVKEGIYLDPKLAELTTANFRLVSGEEKVRIRIQLVPSATESTEINGRFATALSQYITSPFEVSCERYETFGSGMTLDYERKFDYLGE